MNTNTKTVFFPHTFVLAQALLLCCDMSGLQIHTRRTETLKWDTAINSTEAPMAKKNPLIY